MMRYVSITMICVSIILTGMYFARQAKRKAYILEKLSLLFGQFACLAKLGGSEIKSITEEISKTENFKCFSFLENLSNSFYDGCDFCSLWGKCVEKEKEFDCLKNDEKELVKNFSSVFLSSGLDEFCDSCERFSESFSLMSNDAKEYSLRTQQLFISGSALGAVAFFIISF